jgi:hypothetical protein
MHGELAQLIALGAHGSAWLAGRTGAGPPELEGTNSTFQYVRDVRFELEGSVLRKGVVSSDAASWLLAVRARGVNRLWLVTPDSAGLRDRQLAAFVGGVPWSLVATAGDRPIEVWRAGWSVADAEAPDRRIWAVEYRGRRTSRIEVLRPNPAASVARLTAAIKEAQAFSESQGLDEWAAVFGAARQLGTAADPVPPYHPDMFPPTAFGRSARHLLAMASRAFVFGGMGTWNDLAIPAASTEEYERISRELYAAVLEGFVAAVNGSIDR